MNGRPGILMARLVAALLMSTLGACGRDSSPPGLSESTESIGTQEVTSFTLIDADSDQPIAGFDPLPEGAVLNLATLPTQNFNLRANTSTATVGSVRFALDGNSNFRTENTAPYALAGDSNGDYHAWTPSLGSHTVTATPYSASGGGGSAGIALTRQFTVIDSPPPSGGPVVTSFTLINADTNQPIPGFDPMVNGATLDFSQLPTQNLNIRANTSPATVGSVRFALDGNSNFRTESTAPYALAGDSNGDYHAWTPGNGPHTLTATPYSDASASGTAGTPLTLTFTVGDGDCGCDIVVESSTTVLNGDTTPHAPGDTICLMAGQRQPLRIQNFQGSATQPLIIKNCGGLVELRTSSGPYGIDVWNSKHFRLTGTGASGLEYGIKVGQSASMGISLGRFSTDFEVDHVEIADVGFAGIMSKTDPSCGNPDLRNFVQRNTRFHHNYIHDTGGEGFYVGYFTYPQSSRNCGGQQTTLYPHALENVEIHDNVVRNTGWDGIQLGSAILGGAIYRNLVENPGTEDETFQQTGIQLNSGTKGNVYNNIIKGGTGTAIMVFGRGGNVIYNNLVVGPGGDGIFCDDRWTEAGTGFHFINNTIVQPAGNGMRMYSDESTGNSFHNNIIAAPSGSAIHLLSSSIDWNASNNLTVSSVGAAGFVDAAGGNYRLSGNSPACDAGLDTSGYGVTFDLDALARQVPYDIGAYESCR